MCGQHRMNVCRTLTNERWKPTLIQEMRGGLHVLRVRLALRTSVFVARCLSRCRIFDPESKERRIGTQVAVLVASSGCPRGGILHWFAVASFSADPCILGDVRSFFFAGPGRLPD